MRNLFTCASVAAQGLKIDADTEKKNNQKLATKEKNYTIELYIFTSPNEMSFQVKLFILSIWRNLDKYNWDIDWS